MTVTVLAILETDFKPEKALAKVMNDRLIRTAKDLQDCFGKKATDLISGLFGFTLFPMFRNARISSVLTV